MGTSGYVTTISIKYTGCTFAKTSQDPVHIASSKEQTRSITMPRTIILLLYLSSLFPAHWSLCIPSADNPDIVKIIHTDGDAATGFEVVFKRNYNITVTQRNYQVLPLDQVLD